MKAERVIVSFIAVIVGLAAAGVAFYFYQGTKTNHPKPGTQLTTVISPTPTPDLSHLLQIDSPNDEDVFTKSTLTVTGKTTSDATIIISTENSDQVIKPTVNGSFSASITLPTGTSVMHFTAIFSNGDEKKATRTVTYSTEQF